MDQRVANVQLFDFIFRTGIELSQVGQNNGNPNLGVRE